MHLPSKAAPFALTLLTACSSGATGQEAPTEPTSAAQVPTKMETAFLEQYAETYRFRLGRPSQIRITPKGEAILFLRSGPKSFVNDLWTHDPATGEEKILLTAESILQGAAEQLSAEELARRERLRMTSRGIVSFQLSRDGARILVPLADRLFVIERATGRTLELPREGGFPTDPRFSPDGEQVAVVRDGDLWLIELGALGTGGRNKALPGEAQRRLTTRAGPHLTNGLAEFVAQEEMSRFSGYWWSPDGSRIAYQETDTSGVETAYISDSMNPQAPPQPWPYPRPGQANASTRLGVILAEGGETTWIEWDRAKYPYLATVRWQAGAPLTLLVQNRLQTEELLLSADPGSGETRTLLAERDPAWINLDQTMPRWLPGGRGFLWSSERSGRWQLELRTPGGKLERVLTAPEFGYRGLVHVNREGSEVIVSASSNPTETHLYRIPLLAPEKAGELPRAEALTSDPGEHTAAFASDHSIHVHILSSLAGENRFTLRDETGGPIGRLRSVAETPPFLPNVELVELANEHAMRAALIRPRSFNPRLRYPVIAYVYAGPKAQVVTASRERWLLQQWIADQGFIVVSVDGRGTPSRGREWERAIHRNLIDVPLADQVEGLRALGARFPELDMDRVGVYGWSFGGYFSSMAVMRRPELFKAGVAGAPVADWLDYDTHYTERYLDLPRTNPEGYEASSVLTYASELSRPLLVIHGTADDNVYFTHALKISNALFRAGKQHEFLPLAGFTHMVPDPLVTTRLYTRIASFFQEELGGPEEAALP